MKVATPAPGTRYAASTMFGAAPVMWADPAGTDRPSDAAKPVNVADAACGTMPTLSPGATPVMCAEPAGGVSDRRPLICGARPVNAAEPVVGLMPASALGAAPVIVGAALPGTSTMPVLSSSSMQYNASPSMPCAVAAAIALAVVAIKYAAGITRYVW